MIRFLRINKHIINIDKLVAIENEEDGDILFRYDHENIRVSFDSEQEAEEKMDEIMLILNRFKNE